MIYIFKLFINNYVKNIFHLPKSENRFVNFKKNRYVQLTNDSDGPHYSVYEFILDVYKNHSYDDAVIIVSKALRNCGVHYFEIDVEDTMNEMRSGLCNVDHNNFEADYYMKAINTIESHSDIVSNALSYAP